MCIDKFYKVRGNAVKNYLYLALIFLICSYLSPKDRYKKYFQFMLGIFMAVLILRPLSDGVEYDMKFDELVNRIEGISYEFDGDEADLLKVYETEEK